jgi:glycosyltransferase 2 family protein
VRERWWRYLQWLGGAAVLAFVVRYLVQNWDAIRREPIAWRLSPGWLLASLALVLFTYVLLVEAWRRMLLGWGPRLPWLDSARIWVLSSMGKYVPGKLWAIAGMAVMAQRRGVPAWTATASAVVLQVVSIGTGALLVGITGMTTLEAHRPGSKIAVAVILIGSVVGLVAVSWAPLARRLLAGFRSGSNERLTPAPAALGFGLAANFAAWLLYGAALWTLARGILPGTALSFGEAAGAFAGSYIAGLLFLLAPGGLGVREGVFMWMLQDRIGPANALALAAVSRLGMTLADVLAALPFALTRAPRLHESA